MSYIPFNYPLNYRAISSNSTSNTTDDILLMHISNVILILHSSNLGAFYQKPLYIKSWFASNCIIRAAAGETIDGNLAEIVIGNNTSIILMPVHAFSGWLIVGKFVAGTLLEDVTFDPTVRPAIEIERSEI